jgi:integrase
MAARPRSQIKPLTVREVQTAGDGEHSDGLGLLLRVRGASAQWVFRFTSPTGRRRDIGLGGCHRSSAVVAGRSLTLAREQAHSARALVLTGVDPIDHREAQRAAAKAEAETRKREELSTRLTLLRATRDYHERVIEPSRSSKHAAQWIASVEGPPKDTRTPEQDAARARLDAVLAKPIADVTAPELLDALTELHQHIPETAERVLQRLAAVFDDCQFHGKCTGNPAHAIRKKLSEVGRGRTRGQFAALPYREAHEFMRELRQRPGIAARALEFTILTVSRTNEVTGATWAEFDQDAALWTVPAERMKGGEEHRVHLTARALEILKSMRELKETCAFPNPRLNGAPLSNMAMLTVLRRMDADKRTTVHGLARSTFSTWANETGAARPDVIEACLAHREGDRIRAAYNRAQFNADRAALLEAWAAFLDGAETSGKVIEFRAARAA